MLSSSPPSISPSKLEEHGPESSEVGIHKRKQDRVEKKATKKRKKRLQLKKNKKKKLDKEK